MALAIWKCTLPALDLSQRALGSRRETFWRGCALGLWLIIGVAVSTRILINPGKHTVYPVFAGAAEHWWADQPLYCHYPGSDFFRCSPSFAIFMTPFWLLGARAGQLAWLWLNIGTYLTGLILFLRKVLPGDWSANRVSLFLALTAVAAIPGVNNLQSNALAGGMLLLAAISLAEERWWSAAALLAGPVFLKLAPLAVVLLFIAYRPRELLGRFVLVLLAGGLLPFLTRPPDVVCAHYRDWVAASVEKSSERWPGFRDGWTLWALLRDVPNHTHVDSAGYRILQGLSAVAVLAWCRRQWHGAGSVRWQITVTMGMGLAWLMLFGPAVEAPTYVMLAPFVIWAALAYRQGRWLAMAALACFVLLSWRQLAKDWPLAAQMQLAVLPVGTILFAAWLVCFARDPSGTIQCLRGVRPTPFQEFVEESADGASKAEIRLRAITRKASGSTVIEPDA
jgi:hypothetical protein